MKDLVENNPWGENVMRCAIWYHFYNLKNVKNNHGGVFLLVKQDLSITYDIQNSNWVLFNEASYMLCEVISKVKSHA